MPLLLNEIETESRVIAKFNKGWRCLFGICSRGVVGTVAGVNERDRLILLYNISGFPFDDAYMGVPYDKYTWEPYNEPYDIINIPRDYTDPLSLDTFENDQEVMVLNGKNGLDGRPRHIFRYEDLIQYWRQQNALPSGRRINPLTGTEPSFIERKRARIVGGSRKRKYRKNRKTRKH